MTFLEQIQRNWKAMAVIGAILGVGIGGWNYVLARAAETARTETQATVNKAMIDGAKQAAADAVKEQLPAIAKEVAKQAAAEVIKQQKEEAKKHP